MQLDKATKIKLLDFKSVPMRAFHMSWIAFFFAFFSWFGIAPLMAVVREELGLSPDQIATTVIASVSITIVARLLIGWLCDRFGPRRVYTVLLLIGSVPVMCIGLSTGYESFLIFRLLIGVIGASFVITQYHTSLMFGPNVVGTANATTAGWGNLGGGVTQMVMPLIFTLFMGFGLGSFWSWRLSMMLVGIVIVIVGVLYFFLTKDTPNGDFKEASEKGLIPKKKTSKEDLLAVVKDPRVWLLFLVYAGCFGIELTINNVAALYYIDYFDVNLTTAGLIAGLFGLMNIFARTLGGFFGDKFGIKWGIQGRVWFLVMVLAVEGLALILFSRMTALPAAIVSMVVFSLFVQMSEGATFSVVPFVNRRAIGLVAGIVGAGGNVGAMLAGFLFKIQGISYPDVFLILGLSVTAIAGIGSMIRFSQKAQQEAKLEMDRVLVGGGGPLADEA